MYGRKADSSNARYVCGQGGASVPDRTCYRPSIQAAVVESAVWDYVASLISADDVIARAREIGRERIAADETGKRLAEIDAELARLNAKIDEIKARVSALATERESLTGTATDAEYQRIALDALEAQLVKIRRILKQPTTEVKRKIIEAVETRVVVLTDEMGRRLADVETLLGDSRLPLLKPQTGRPRNG